MKFDEKQGFLKFQPEESIKKTDQSEPEHKVALVKNEKKSEPIIIEDDDKDSCSLCGGSGMCKICDRGRALTKQIMDANEGKITKNNSRWAKRRWKFKVK